MQLEFKMSKQAINNASGNRILKFKGTEYLLRTHFYIELKYVLKRYLELNKTND